MLFRVLICSILMGIMAHTALGQALSARDCAEIYATYGVQPSSCPTQGRMASSLPTQQAWAQAPTQAERQSHIFFRAGGTALDSSALAQIESLSKLLNTDLLQDTCLMLVGHSDSIGDPRSNMRLSAARTAVVHNALQTRISTPSRITRVEARGEEAPLRSMRPANPWQRRVEIRAKKCVPSG